MHQAPSGGPRDVRRPCAALLAAFAMVAAGCVDCHGGGVGSSAGVLELSEETIDFGLVALRHEAEHRVIVRNAGRGPLRIRSLERDGLPDTFRIGSASVELEPGAEGELRVVFAPTDEGVQAGRLFVNTDAAEAIAVLSLTGHGFRPRLSVSPAEVDFGPVVAGEIVETSATLTNDGDTPVDVQLDAPTGATAEAFRASFTGETSRVIRLQPGTRTELRLSFRPVEVGEVAATLPLRACGACEPVTIALRGRGVAAGLVPEPGVLEFGSVLPGMRATRTLVFRNIGGVPQHLVSVRPAVASSAFDVEPPLVELPALVRPDEAIEVVVGYRPTKVGFDAAQLVVTTDDPRTPSFHLDVRGYGGGPSVDLTPARLEFGLTGLTYPVTRRLFVQNAGPSDPASDLDVLVVTEVVLEAPGSTWSLEDGLQLPLEVQPGHRALVNVRYAPIDAGLDEAELVLRTNDPLRPEVRVPLSGTGEAVHPCDYVLVPAASTGLRFGLLSRGHGARLSFQLRNAGPADCLVSRVELAADTPDVFRLPDGGVYGRRLAPGATLHVPVEFAPGSAVPAAGQDFAGVVEVEMTSESAPRQDVVLSGRGAEVCLSLTPPGAVFGVVPPQCRTNERTFTLHNACRTSVDVERIEQRLGRDVFAVTPPALPVRLPPAGELTFRVHYAPTTQGDHLGTIEVFTGQASAAQQPSVLTLEGRSEPDALVEETFVQADRTQADILFVVDDSGSMEEEQATLSREFDSFMRFAITQGIDYRVAVTSTGAGDECRASDPQGRFLPIDSPTRVVTSQTPDAAAVFRRNVKVGLDGCDKEAGLEAAYRALSAPNLSGQNAGFLRADAVLGLVVVSDEDDVSPRPVEFYTNYFLGLKGARGANLVTFGAIVGDRPGGCTGLGGRADYGGRYVDAARRLNGMTESICAPNWGTALQKLGMNAFGYRSRFVLASEPEPGSLRVWVDDVEVPAGTLWDWTPGANAVDFEPTAIPPAGAPIRVTYRVACH